MICFDVRCTTPTGTVWSPFTFADDEAGAIAYVRKLYPEATGFTVTVRP
jgi:hypothetical protein